VAAHLVDLAHLDVAPVEVGVEQRQPGRGARQQQNLLGDLRGRDPHFLARYDVFTALPFRLGLQVACIEPGVRLGDGQSRRGKYIVSGQKVWISTAQVAEKVLLLARAAAGLTLFYTDFDRRHVEVREIDKMGRHAVGLEPGVLRRAAGARSGPHRRGRQGLRVHPARH